MLVYTVNMAVGVQPCLRQAAAYLEAPEVAKLPTSLAAGSLVPGEAWGLMGLPQLTGICLSLPPYHLYKTLDVAQLGICRWQRKLG